MNTLIALGGIMMFLAVALGAFGAHALNNKLTANGQLKNYQTGVLYHLTHGLGMILTGILGGQLTHDSLLLPAGWLLFAGIILFSGSLYTMGLTGIRKLGAITPLGGLCFLAGWALVVIAAIQG